MWNLQRIDVTQFDHFTIGYSYRSWSMVAEILQAAGVDTVVDVRYEGHGRNKPGFSESNLHAAVLELGLDYVRLPEFGITPGDRQQSGKKRGDRVLDAYSNRVTITTLNDRLGDRLRSEKLAFLTLDLDPDASHRSRIALMLEAGGFKTLDL